MKKILSKKSIKQIIKNKNIFKSEIKNYSNKIDILNGGLYSLVQDFPGRQGYWRVGVSPSGPMDSYSFRIANRIVGNSEDAAALEMTYSGSSIKFNNDTVIAITGASMVAELDGQQINYNQPIKVKKGQTLVCSNIDKPEGARTYLAIRGGINVPEYLGSKSTFPLGKFGGFEGRELRQGDSLEIGSDIESEPKSLPSELIPKINNDWEVSVVGGPQDLGFLTEEDVKLFYESTWTVSHNASRLGVRLEGPKMKWARPDGGEGGSHPSNLHDNAYSIGSINFTGDHPVILTADGPSLGGFICPATIPSAELWKVGQLKPGDKIRFKRISVQESVKLRKEQDESIKSFKKVSSPEIIVKSGNFGIEALSYRQEANGNFPSVSYRLGGDNYILVEYGEPLLDLNNRVRIHALEKWLRENKIKGLIDTVPGVRSLLVQYDSQKLPPKNLIEILKTAEKEIGNLSNFKVRSRILHLPMAFRDQWSLAAIQKYQSTVRDEAPYLPDNIDFIAANNGITSEEVRKMIFDTSYMVLGLGDVYLGAPCAVPVDPRQRLVVPKYNPARTFTPEGTVGIGGTYMCIYGMDSPGGYQLIGRTLPIWNTKGDMPYFSKDKPWLLDMFDQVRYFQVSDDEVDKQRNSFRKGELKLKIEEEEFDANKYTTWVKSLEKETQQRKEIQKKAQNIQLKLDEEMQIRAQEKKENVPRVLNYLAEMIVNGPSQFHPGASNDQPSKSKPYVPILDPNVKPGKANSGQAPPRGFKNIFDEEGPEGFAKAVRAYPGALLTDTTWRDAHQSLLATRVRTKDLLEIAHSTAHVLHNAYSIECWGGATFDVALRFLHECPWDRLAELRELVPNVPFQMLLRGANAVGYTSYPDNVVYKFCKKAKDHGMDVFRVFDSLNYIDNMKLGIDAVGESGGIIEAAICYSGDVADPSKTKYTLDYYLDFAQKLVKCGIHVLCVKDMAGLLRPSAARMLIGALRREHPNIPIHVHCHDTSGTGVASMLACIEAGADAVDCASDAMSGLTSQPSMGALVNELRNTGIDHNEMLQLTRYWEGARRYYAPFESGQKSAGSDVYINEIPGGQYTNMLFQALSLGLYDQWDEIKEAYHQANLLLGDIIKVTPSSKTVGDLAQFMVNNKLSPEDVIKRANELNFPSSTVEFFRGLIGHPHGGFPEPLRTGVLKGRFETVEGRPGASLPPLNFEEVENDLVKKYGRHKIRDVDVVSYSQYPKVFEDYMTMQSKYGKITRLPTNFFLAPLEIGETVQWDTNKVTLNSISPINEEGNPNNGNFNVNFDCNGKPVSVPIKPQKKGQEPFIIARKGGKVEQVEQSKSEKADKTNTKHVAAPMPGKIQEVKVKVGDKVTKGDPILVINSMKMETVIGAPVSGKVKRIVCVLDTNVSSGDLLLEMD